jgi:hypothetical protein
MFGTQVSLRAVPPAIVVRRAESAGRLWGKARFFVVILPYHAPDHLEAHELVHVSQWWVSVAISAAVLAGIAHVVPMVSYYAVALSMWTFNAAYLLSSRFRYWSELQAYAVSYREDPSQIRTFAAALAGPQYGSGKSVIECTDAIFHRAGV